MQGPSEGPGVVLAVFVHAMGVLCEAGVYKHEPGVGNDFRMIESETLTPHLRRAQPTGDGGLDSVKRAGKTVAPMRELECGEARVGIGDGRDVEPHCSGCVIAGVHGGTGIIECHEGVGDGPASGGRDPGC